MKVILYHNPKCGTSRGALEIIRAKGIEPEIIEYLKTPLTRDEIAALAKQTGGSVRDILRWKEPLAAELGLEKATDDQLLDAMAEHPILLNRPIVVVAGGSVVPRTKLCRPSETVRELF